MTTQTTGEALVDLLSQYEVEYIFGMPGTHSIELYRGLTNSSIQHISPRHEQGGGFMADGYARISGKPGVCFVITGPGVSNIATPMAEAYMDAVPMLVVSPVNDPDPEEINRGRLHEITNQEKLTAPVSGETTTITEADEIAEAIDDAFRRFAVECPRPVHIHIPLSVIPRVINKQWHRKTIKTAHNLPEQDLARCFDLISAAENPVMIIGGGSVRASKSIRRLAEVTGCAITTTVAGRGVISGDHPQHLGAQLRANYVQQVVADSDLAIILGSEVAQPDHWNDHLKLPKNQIRVNLNPHSIPQSKSIIGIHFDCDIFAKGLLEMLPALSDKTIDSLHQRCEQIRENRFSELNDKQRHHCRVLSVVDQFVEQGINVVSDMTQLAYTTIAYYPTKRPNQWLHPTGFGALGYALPAAIGAALADPETPVLAIIGDAGLQYTMQEMTLASELELSIVILLWNNDALQQISDDMDEAGIEPIAVTQWNPDFIALAKACHWAAQNIESLDDLKQTLEQALDAGKPVLLNLHESIK